MTNEELARRFAAYPDPEKAPIYQAIRENCMAAAEYIREVSPDCRERSLAFTHLEEAMFWANAGVARNAIKRSQAEESR